MTLTRLLILTLTVCTPLVTLQAQRPQTIPRQMRKFYLEQPRTSLEEMDGRLGTVIVKGFMPIGTITGRGGSAEVSAVEIKSNQERVTGLTIQIQGSTPEIQSFVDYDEIESLVNALEAALRASDTITKFPNFSVTYRTRDDFTIAVFRQTRSGVAAKIELSALNGTGGIDRVAIYVTLDELTKLRGIILEARQRLDEFK